MGVLRGVWLRAGDGRVDTKVASDPLRRRLRRLQSWERREEAVAFLREYYFETGLPEADMRARIRDVTRSLARHGHYEHTPEELAFGARVAWRNHARCIGRLPWQSLDVRDRRMVTDPDAMAGEVFEHMRLALGTGRVRSMITIFAPMREDRTPIVIESAQVTQYAGYLLEGGETLGDQQNIEITQTARRLGWSPPQVPTAHDILPLILRTPTGRRLLYACPPDAQREVEIRHPDWPDLGRLGLRWYALPCVSGMILTIGGIDYPCAPFNGHYMCTEIASRNLIDVRRYGKLDAVARAIGERPEADPTGFWRDRAVLELNRAVKASFDRAGVTMIDHHAASADYMLFDRRERAAGRAVSGDWAWIVPPQASATCPVFHLPMTDLKRTPNFYHDRATDGRDLAPHYGEAEHGLWWHRGNRLRRRFGRWLSQRG